ncbi:LAMI_0H08724g1_1 [Lachancea mirantina]|uniref:LAMI_0H08724g1_1 n=1 Tax=Lachancea mirantina TaxID=1230905 RepID=A0A1G4KG33_9SACH|nr:LAMI_0H08724g1_1 [Lachancea mirantina]
MFHKRVTVVVPEDLKHGNGRVLEIFAIHFSNKIVIQMAWNGEMDSTYEVISKGLAETETGPNTLEFSDEDDVYGPDKLANFQVVTLLGDANDMKTPIVCTQIAELYQKVVFPAQIDGLGGNERDSRFVISLSRKLWQNNESNADFGLLVFVLQSIRKMYGI